MTSSSNPKPQPTAPGWWWARDKKLGLVEIVQVNKVNSALSVSVVDSAQLRSIQEFEWIGPVLSHEEGQRLRQRVADMEAQQARVMGAIDETEGEIRLLDDGPDGFGRCDVSMKNVLKAIRDKINEAKAGEK
jgi:hypothetical protein